MVDAPSESDPRILELQEKLEALLGSSEVHLQAPPSSGMNYPAIKYELDDMQTVYADNTPYHTTRRWQVTLICREPDSNIPAKIAKLPMCSFDRFFTADNLNHFVFNLFF